MSEPFDDQELLQLIERAEGYPAREPRPLEHAELLRLAHLASRLLEETIRLRVARHRLSLLEQGQTLLPLSPSTETNQPMPNSHA